MHFQAKQYCFISEPAFRAWICLFKAWIQSKKFKAWPELSAWIQSLSAAPDVRAYIPIQNSELEFRARIQSLDSGPGFRAKI